MKPKHFNFAHEWDTSIKLVRNRPKIINALKSVEQRWIEIAEFRRDEEIEFDLKQAEAEFKLAGLTFAVMEWDLHWQREWTRGSDTLNELSLAIAETLFPKRKWELIGDDEFEIAVDSDRNIVLDIHKFDKLPAGASIYLAGDRKYQPDEIDLQLAQEYLKAKVAATEAVVKKIRSDIEFVESQNHNNILPLKIGIARPVEAPLQNGPFSDKKRNDRTFPEFGTRSRYA